MVQRFFKQSLIVPAAFIVVCGYSVWLIFCSLHPPLPLIDEEPRLYSNQCQQDLRLIYVNAILQSHRSINLVMFGLSEPAILNALAERAKHGIPTTIYYDAAESTQLANTLGQADLHPVQIGGLMHQKILILDHDLVFIGSANMTASSLCMHDNLVVGMRSGPIADFLMKRIPYSSGFLQTMVGGQEVELWLLPDPRGNALASLRHQIRKATRSLKIALFTLTHPSLCEEIIAAKKRKVDVTVVVDLHSGLGASSKAIRLLQQNQIKVLFSQGVQLLHHKFVWIDDQTLLCGSANWTKAAFEKNSDCILALHHLTREQKKFMKNLWNRIETEAALPIDK
jgi:phosphatidylserine/phosphatidylglycerophosphate/cardiolipin synthase-like enzyme